MEFEIATAPEAPALLNVDVPIQRSKRDADAGNREERQQDAAQDTGRRV